MVRFSRAWRVVLRMGHPLGRWSVQMMTQDGGKTAQLQGDHEGFRDSTTKLGGMCNSRVRCINDFCKDIDKKTVIVMDNSPMHTSEVFQENIPLWKEVGLDIFYLPKYSPELHCIEILWRFIKYEWIELDAYQSWTHLVNYVENVL